MMATGTRATIRLLALVAILVLALAAASCGSDDGDGGDGGSANAASKDSGDGGNGSSEPAAQTGTPQERIRTAYESFVNGFYEEDPAAICEGMTTSAQKRFGKSFKRDSSGKGAPTCEAQMRLLIDSAESFSKNKPKVVRLKVNGDKAVVGAKTRNSDTYTVPYAKEGGVWKVSGGFGVQ